MKPIAKAALVFAGYLGAFLAATITFYLCQARAQENPALYSSGMSADGDSVLILGVFAAAAFIPTALGLYFLRPYEKFWKFFSIFSLLLAATGPLAEVLNSSIRSLHSEGPLWELVGFLSLVRIGASLILGPGFILFAVFSPVKSARKLLLIAAGIEAAVFLYVAVHLLVFKSL